MSANPQSEEVIRVDLNWEGSIAVLTINNVARKNALSPQIKDDLIRHIGHLNQSKECKAIVLTGAGGAFSAGGDVKGMKERGAAGVGFMQRRGAFAMSEVNLTMTRMLAETPKPLVTAVEGIAVGAGMSFAVIGDYTVAASNARFAAAQILRGLCPDLGMYYLVTARCGPGRARELLLSGRPISAADAERYGLVHEISEPGKALEQAIIAAERFAAVPPLAFALTKSAMLNSYHTLEACFRAEQDYQPVVGLSKDHKESVAAFLEKRKPVYVGE